MSRGIRALEESKSLKEKERVGPRKRACPEKSSSTTHLEDVSLWGCGGVGTALISAAPTERREREWSVRNVKEL